MRRHPALTLFVAGLVWLAPSGSAQAAFPGANGKIAFVDYSLGSISAIYPNGTGITQLAESACAAYAPNWSSDGTKFTWTHDDDCESSPQILISSADGTLLSGAGYGSQSSWSPDGTKLVFFRDGYLWTGNADGTNRVQIPNSQLYDLAPAWSPDGSKIAFQYGNPNGAGIATIRPNGTDRTILTSGTGDRQPSWSPDGSKLAFARSGIWTMNADGTGQTQVTATGFGPSWSPDGSSIAYVTSDHSLHTVNADGTGDSLVLDGGVGYEYDGGKTDWQPLPGSSPAPPYEAPKLAAPIHASLVSVFRQCGTGANPTDGQHSPPLGTAACLPPQAQGVAHFGPQAKGTAWVAVIYGDTNALNGDQADATLRFDLSDIQTAGGADYNPNPSGPDGTLVTRLRFTDRANGPSGTSAGTATDLDFSVPFACTPTSDPALGSTCALDTSADAVNPGAIKENKVTVLQVFRLRLNDSGPNGVRGDSDDRLFATEGIYIS